MMQTKENGDNIKELQVIEEGQLKYIITCRHQTRGTKTDNIQKISYNNKHVAENIEEIEQTWMK